MNIVKSVGNLARRAAESPALVRRAAFIAPFNGSVLSEVLCTASSLWTATFVARIANDADEPLFCSVFGETAHGLDALEPSEFRIEPRTRGSATFVARRRLLRPYQRVIISMRNGALQYSIDAKMPPLALGERLRIAGAAIILASVATFVYVCTHPMLAFGAIPPALTNATISIPYDASGIGHATYNIHDGARLVASGALTNGSGAFSLTTGPQPRTYALALHWAGPMASRDATTTLQSTAPPNTTPPPQVRALELEKSTVSSGDHIVVLYDAAATAGDISLLDTAQIAVARAPFDRSGKAEIVAPSVEQATPYRVQLHVTRGGAATNASIGVEIVPKQQVVNPSTGDDGAVVGDIMRVDQPFVVGGQSLHVNLVEHQFPVHVSLQDESGAIVAQTDVQTSADGADFSVPHVTSEQRYVVVITYSSGQGQQTMLLPIDVHPS